MRQNTSPQQGFDGDTPVTTNEGLVPISEIEVGDYVLAYHEETGEVGYYPVTATWVHEDPVLTYLVIEGEFIATTPTHLFYTTEGWVEAGELGEDAYVVRAGGAPGQVWESLTFTHPRQMYDLTVAEAHTFFVGSNVWLVHNCSDSVYSVYYEATIPEGSWATSRGAHFQIANESLNDAMNSDPLFAQGMEALGVNQADLVSPSGTASRQSPNGFTWHHADESGVIQLVDRNSHRTNFGLFHPTGSGGYKRWGPR